MHKDSREPWLGGASGVPSLAPLAEMPQLRQLNVDSLLHVHDLSPLGSLSATPELLEIGGDWMSPRVVHVDSVAFLRSLPHLESLVLHTMIVDNLDYSPLLSLGRLPEVRVMPAQGMRPLTRRTLRGHPCTEAPSEIARTCRDPLARGSTRSTAGGAYFPAERELVGKADAHSLGVSRPLAADTEVGVAGVEGLTRSTRSSTAERLHRATCSALCSVPCLIVALPAMKEVEEDQSLSGEQDRHVVHVGSLPHRRTDMPP